MPGRNNNYPASDELRRRFLDAMPEDRWTTAKEMAGILFHNRSYVRAILNQMSEQGQISIVHAPIDGQPNLYRRPLPERACTACGHVGPLSDFNRDYRHDAGVRYYPGCKKCRTVRENLRRKERREVSQPTR